jgi:hypothetical protein
MSAGVSTAPVAAVAHHHPLAAHWDASISLTGQADGTYTSTQGPPDTGTRYKLKVSGTITPIGSAVVNGSFHTPGFIRGGKVTGRLKIVGSRGKVILQLTEPGPIIAGAFDLPNGVNPGGPIKGLTPSSGVSPSTSSGPVILVNDFLYSVVKGTGKYAHDKGTGTVEITTTPGLATPPPGIYSSPMTAKTGIGRTTLTFESGPVPLT